MQNRCREAVQPASRDRESRIDALQLAIRDLENKLALALQHNADMYTFNTFSVFNVPRQSL